MILQHLPEIRADEVAMPGMRGVATQGLLIGHPLLPGFVLTAPNEFHQMVNASEDDVMRFFDVVGPFQAE